MKTLGVVGGIGPESTIVYYRSIIAAGRELGSADEYPPVLVNSIDLRKVLRLAEEKALGELTDYLVAEVEALARAGAAMALLAANTPHIVFDEVQQRSPIPLVSIVDAARDATLERKLKRPGLLGTRFTMQGRFYPDAFSRAGVELAIPRETEQDYIHEKYVHELLNGVILPRTREGLLKIVDLMKERDRIDAVILAGTELPLILSEKVASSLPLLDTTQIHVKAAVKRIWG